MCNKESFVDNMRALNRTTGFDEEVQSYRQVDAVTERRMTDFMSVCMQNLMERGRGAKVCDCEPLLPISPTSNNVPAICVPTRSSQAYQIFQWPQERSGTLSRAAAGKRYLWLLPLEYRYTVYNISLKGIIVDIPSFSSLFVCSTPHIQSWFAAPIRTARFMKLG
ncbi:hypothetical protein IAQ61_001328, partial [Plenodomus lingam]|uniref:Predicted protein n=1 Tax=Leptosphaeria maculans (strain JN3 / isolate v23.1.3 / race Av1-4-5-6-7-8) TaxID=985895 RepID=E4ZXR0_LEPMJ